MLIVIVGVVLGFQVTGWGQARADRTSEQGYLVQLADDLRETERDAARIDSQNRRADQAEAYLARAFYLAERPTADSLLAWYVPSSYIGTFRPVLGTAEALVATGDLALIEAISRYRP